MPTKNRAISINTNNRALSAGSTNRVISTVSNSRIVEGKIIHGQVYIYGAVLLINGGNAVLVS